MINFPIAELAKSNRVQGSLVNIANFGVAVLVVSLTILRAQPKRQQTSATMFQGASFVTQMRML